MLTSLRAKLTLRMLIVTLIPIVLITGWTIRTRVASVQAQAESLLTKSSGDRTVALQSRIDSLQDQAELLARATSPLVGNTAALQNLMESTQAGITAAGLTLFADTTGRSTVNTSRTTLELADHTYVQTALRGLTAVQIIASRVDGKTLLVGAAPVRNARGAILGVVAIGVDMSIDRLLQFAHFGDTGEIYLVGREGYFVTQPRFLTGAVLTRKACLQALEMFKPGASFHFFGRYTDYRGHDVYGSMVYLPAVDMVLVTKKDRASFYAEAYTDALASVSLGLVGLALSATVAWVSAVNFANRIKPLSSAAQLVAGGDLALNYTAVADRDEIGDLSRAFASMVKNLGELIKGAQTSAQEVAERAGLISGSIAEVAAGNNSQANITQEVTKALEQLAAATEEIAANAQHASAASEVAQQAAADGTTRIGNAIASLNTVQENVTGLVKVSQQIGGIVNTIESIADQTNLLALNAAIEAARAGEHGRGFAVVADAVRSLAEQSRESTQEISRLIRSIQAQIDTAVKVSTQGTAGARGAREALDNIVVKVNEIALMIEGISAAGEEQAASANEVSASMQNLGAITEEVAASSEETAAASAQLAELGKGLDQAARRFRV
ncbi:MAG: Methyl-accepting chemotaxis protein McpQ [Firmicutes bacterium]|nr:Methyl-accepting chemotaxis protein McpQ [candidate division NPL-UPA2 bacterium]